MPNTKSRQVVVAKAQRHESKERGAGLKMAYSHTKVGCKMCKIRKIRCDETPPNCRNCIKTGRKCDGIPMSALRFAAPITISEPSPSMAAGSFMATFAMPLTLSHFWPAKCHGISPEEVACLDIFRHRLVDGIAGEASPSWKQLILQAVHEEPALCHAATAFGALHNFSADAANKPMELTTAQKVTALRHYNQCLKGMREIISSGSGRDKNTILICMLLCICFELRVHNHYTSLSHLEHGLRIINSDPTSVDEDLAIAFSKLDVQTSIFLGQRVPALDLEPWSAPSFGTGSLEAHKDITKLQSKLFIFCHKKVNLHRYERMEDAPLYLHAESNDLRLELDQFQQKYLRNLPDPANAAQLPQLDRLVWLKYMTACIVQSVFLNLEETQYDPFLADFVAILAIAESLLTEHAQPIHFSLNMGIIYPLFKTGQKCRSPHIRRRAIHLLSKMTWSEGPWDAMSYRKYAERIMQIEEDGLGFDKMSLSNLEGLGPEVVPEWQRIHLMDIQPMFAERYSVVTFRRRLNGLDGEWDDVVEVLKW